MAIGSFNRYQHEQTVSEKVEIHLASSLAAGPHPSPLPDGEGTRNAVPTKWRALKTSLALSLLFLLVYGSCNYYTSLRSDVGTWVYAWEKHIPFVPLFIVPYMSIDLFFVVAPFLCTSEGERKILSRRITLAILLAGAFFLLMPLRFTFERPITSGWVGEFFNWFRTMDQPFNQFPSLHIALRSILADTYWRHTRGWLQKLIGFWFSLIGASTLLVYQHHVIDLVGGFLLAVVCFYVVRGTPWRLTMTGNRRVCVYYALGCALCTILAILFRPWSMILLWPAAAMLVVTLGYLGLGPAIFRKEAGELPLGTRLLLAPVLFAQELSRKHYAKKSDAWNEVAPNLWLGRWLTESEAREAVQKGVVAVVDLTGEFPATRAFRSVAYLNLPVLDLTAPTPAQLDEAIAFIDAHIARGAVYVHCKAGYSRSGGVAGAYLIAHGQSNTEAIEHLRQSRRGIVLRPEILRSLEVFAAKHSKTKNAPLHFEKVAH